MYRSAWNILQEKYNDKFFYGCVAHALNLLFGDIMSLHISNNIFEFMKDLQNDAIDIVNFFKNHHQFNFALRYHMREEKRIQLVTPGATRWASFYYCLLSIVSNL